MASAEEMSVQTGGASFPFEAYRLIFSNFELLSQDIAVTYTKSSSGTGRSLLANGDLDFSGSDSLLKDADYEVHPSWQMIPSISGAVAVAINLPDYLSNGWNMVLDAATVSGIFQGKITDWADSAIIDRNLGYCSSYVGDINVHIRTAKSGTTEVFTKWLNSADPDWETNVGVTKMMPDLGNFSTFTSSTALMDSFLSTDGTMTYLSYADLFGMNTGYIVSIINRAEEAVLPNDDNIAAAALGAVFNERFNADIFDMTDRDAWPISTFSYFIVDTADCMATPASLSVLNWFFASTEASNLMQLTGFAPVEIATREEALDIIRQLRCEGAISLQASIEDERSNAPLLITVAFAIYGVTAVASFLGFINYLIVFSSEADARMKQQQFSHHLHGFICLLLLNACVLPWFFSPEPAICQLRLTIFVAWGVVLSWFNMRASQLNSLLDRKRSAGAAALEINLSIFFIIIQIAYSAVWIFAMDTRVGMEIIDPVFYTGRNFCTSNGWNGLLVGQVFLIIAFTTKMLNSIYSVVTADSVSRRISRKLMTACASAIASFFMAFAYGVAQTTLRDIDYFIIVALLNFIGFSPLFLSLIEFNNKHLKQTISGSKNSQTSRGPNNNSLQSIQEPNAI
jgi:phosphate transport system substrate-binding protein